MPGFIETGFLRTIEAQKRLPAVVRGRSGVH